MAAVTGVDVIVGASFTLATVTVKLCVTVADEVSTTRTETALAPTCALVGVQLMTPVEALMLIPVGAVVSE